MKKELAVGAWMGCLVLASVRGADAGTVTGTVKVGGLAEAEQTVVYIESAVPGGTAPSPAPLSQKGARFKPQVLPVVKGTTVDVTNDDWVAHNVFSKSEVRPFDLGLYPPGERKTITFDKAGVVEVFCAIHPRMNAVVLVLQNPHFAKPARDGRFSLGEIPPGVYDLAVFRLGNRTIRRTITVPENKDVVVGF